MRRITFLLIILLGFGLAALGEGASPRRAVLLLVDKIALSDLDRPDLPNLSWVASHGGIALMNARTAETLSRENACLTLGSGSRAAATLDAGLAYAAAESLEGGTAAQILQRNTGYRARPASLVLPGIAGIAAVNAGLDHPVTPGLLGELLHHKGLKACVIGNADLPDILMRQGVALAMDAQGTVDEGEIGAGLLAADRSRPYGVRTDYDSMLVAYDRFHRSASLFVIDCGDTARLEAYAAYLAPERAAELRHRILTEVDGFLGKLRRRQGFDQTLLMLLCPTPTLAMPAGVNALTPILACGPGFQPGWLTSATTKQPGLVANIDVAPTVMSFLGLSVPPEIDGRPLTTSAVNTGLPGLLKMERRVSAIALWQQSVLKVFTVVLDVIFALCLLFLFWNTLPGKPLFQALLLAAASLPLLLLGPWFPASGLFPFWLTVGALLPAVILTIAGRFRLWPLALVCGATVAAIAIDQLAGAPLAQYSILSYSPISGSRYYGLGNEYMGVFLGGALVAAGMAADRFRGKAWFLPILAAVFLILTVVMAAPTLGTNFGGTIAALAGFLAALAMFARRRLSWRIILIWAGAAAGLLVILAFVDSLRAPAAQTHLGRLAGEVRTGGLTPFLQVAQRKLAMNLKLIRFSGWTRTALFALTAMLLTALFPLGRGKAIAAKYPGLTKGIYASLIAALAAFVANDSGVVAAGTLLIFPATAWLYVLLVERTASRTDQVPNHLA